MYILESNNVSMRILRRMPRFQILFLFFILTSVPFLIGIYRSQTFPLDVHTRVSLHSIVVVNIVNTPAAECFFLVICFPL